MNFSWFFWFLLIGLIAGFLAGKIWRGSGFGIIGDLVVGVLGAVIGGAIAEAMGIGGGGIIWSILIATLGAILLLFVIGLVRGGKK